MNRRDVTDRPATPIGDDVRDRVSTESRVHDLKTHPRYWQHVAAGLKRFEVRKDDRGFREGDVLVLHEWPEAPRRDQPCMCKSGGCHRPTRRIRRRVTYVLPGGQYGIEAGYVVLGLERLTDG